MGSKQEHQPRLKALRRLIYNPDDKSFLSRTAKSWALLLLFYTVAYLFLSGFFFGMLYVFLYGYVHMEIPSLTGYQSLLKLSPGTDVSPTLQLTNTFYQLFAYPSELDALYVEKAKLLLSSYNTDPPSIDCTKPDATTSVERVCQFPLSQFGPCQNPEKELAKGAPCFYIKLNKIFGWLPALSNATLLPASMIKCRGQNPLDIENLGNPVYHPSFTDSENNTYGIIPNMYFPFLNQKGYQTPMVAVQFPEIVPSVVVLIECQLFGLDSSDAAAKFEVVVDMVPSQG